MKEAYHMTLTMDKRFAIFPVQLRTRLQTAYAETIRVQMRILKTGIARKIRFTFSIVTDLRIRQSGTHTGLETTICKDSIRSLSIANTTLFEMFIERSGKYLEKPAFVELKTEAGIANPDFIQLHSVRRNEIGWGFDMNGCMSLYLVYMDDGKLKEFAMFVQRTQIKLEEQV